MTFKATPKIVFIYFYRFQQESNYRLEVTKSMWLIRPMWTKKNIQVFIFKIGVNTKKSVKCEAINTLKLRD